MTTSTIDVERAKLDPASEFGSPIEVISTALSAEQKFAILERWEADAEALLRANEEGMQAGDNRDAAELLRSVQRARALLAEPKGSHSHED